MGSSPISLTIDTLRAAHCMMCLLSNLIWEMVVKEGIRCEERRNTVYYVEIR